MKMMKYGFYLIFFFISVGWFHPDLHAAPTVIKVAVVMPEGSTWTHTLYEMTREVERRSNNEIGFKIYAGGVSGDEDDVLRKMQVNRIHAAGFSGIGLGYIVPEIRVLESVLLFESYDEIDWVREQLFDDFAARFEKKGLALLGFFDGGFTYIFSRQPVDRVEAINGMKMWIWKGDDIAANFLKVMGIKAFPLPMPDVNTGLETGMIDAFYAPPLAAVALQWYARVSYMIDFPLVNSMGGFLINKRTFDRLSEENRNLLKTAVKTYALKLVELTRKENAQALSVMKAAGIIASEPDEQMVMRFQSGAEKSYEANIPGIYSRALIERVRSLLKTYRDGKTH